MSELRADMMGNVPKNGQGVCESANSSMCKGRKTHNKNSTLIYLRHLHSMTPNAGKSAIGAVNKGRTKMKKRKNTKDDDAFVAGVLFIGICLIIMIVIVLIGG